MYVHFFKRVIDLVCALIAFPFVLLLIIIIGPFIWLDDKGPIFYAGKRIGLHGKPFGMLKFRSMKVNAPDIRLEDGSTYNGDDDPRVTKVGKFLRKTSLDEIPQFLNVLVDVSAKLLSYENDVMSKEKEQNLKHHLNEIDEIEKKALSQIKSDIGRHRLKTQTEEMKEVIRKLYNWE